MIRRINATLFAAALTAAGLTTSSASAQWKIGTVVAPPSMLGVLVDEMAADIGKLTQNRVTAVRFQNPNEQELTQNVIRGRLEMGYISATGMAVAVPEAGVLNMPYIWLSDAERDYVTDKYAVPLMAQILDGKGLTLVRFGEAGWTNIFCKGPCTKPADLKGMKIRVSPTAGDKMMFERLGANGVQMTLADFYPALQQGVVDGGTLTFSFYLITPASQAAPHYVFTKHSHQPAMLIAHKATWAKVSKADQDAVSKGLVSVAAMRKRVADDERPKMDVHRSKGGTVHLLTDEQRAEWAKVIAPGQTALVESYGGRAKEFYDTILKGKKEYAGLKK